MGAWGPGIFDDDDAADARDEFMALVAELRDPVSATAELLRKAGISLADLADNSAFILGLALTQARKGWLQEEVRAAAARIIDDGLDIGKWQSADRSRRQSVLRRARLQLEKPRKASRLPPRPPARVVRRQLDDVRIGEILLRRLPSGRLAVMKAVEFAEIANWRVVAPVVRLLKWTSPLLPRQAEVEKLDELHLPLRPDGISAFTKLSLATDSAEPFLDFIRPGWILEVGPVPASGLTTTSCIRMKCSIDEMLEHAIARWWDDPGLPADAPPPWLVRNGSRAA